MWRWTWTAPLVLGIGVIVLGTAMAIPPAAARPVGFTPSSYQLSAISRGDYATTPWGPPACTHAALPNFPDITPAYRDRPETGYGYSPENGNLKFRMHRTEVIELVTTPSTTVLLSKNIPLCNIGESNEVTWFYYALSAGRGSIYFQNGATRRITVLDVSVSESPPPSSTPGLWVAGGGALLVVFGAYLGIRGRTERKREGVERERAVVPEPQYGGPWGPDPAGIHGARYYSGGVPTNLVRDGTHESYDPIPQVGAGQD